MSIMSQELSSKKRKNSRSKGTNKPKNKLFATLHSLEQTDARASKKRKASFQSNIKRSQAANEESKINGILVELRILVQRSLGQSGGGLKVEAELDGLLENMLVARRDLMGHQLGEAEGDVDYSELIQSDCSSDEDTSRQSLSTTLENEYSSLRAQWKSTLNKHHSNLALHSGLAVSSKFQSKAVDVSFWEQVQSSVEHDRFKKDRSDSEGQLGFDDSKLYSQMLKDFISSGGGASTNKKGVGLDPAQDAAERLKRAMRKKSGVDVDLTAVLNSDSGNVVNGGTTKKNTVDRKASKGRKIRYVVHPKLVNFTFPVARSEPMIRDDVWFKSLFGGVDRR
jgi:protein AATF/BFR2